VSVGGGIGVRPASFTTLRRTPRWAADSELREIPPSTRARQLVFVLKLLKAVSSCTTSEKPWCFWAGQVSL
jgi:hypothetical protein